MSDAELVRPRDSRRSEVLVIGESLVDVIQSGEGTLELPGGSPMNVAVGLARLGASVSFLTRLGKDLRGSTISERLRAAGIRVLLPMVDAPTAVAIARLDDSGAAEYTFDLRWALPPVIPAFPHIDAVHFGSLGAALRPGAERTVEVVEALAQEATVTFDPNIRPQLESDPDAARQRVESHVALSDLVKASEEDLGFLYPGRPPGDVAQAWLQLGASLVVVTLGERGSFAVARAGRIEAGVPPTTVVDTIGAGDSYMAALIAGLGDLELLSAERRDRLATIGKEELEYLLRFAGAAAAVTVARAGAEPPTRSDVGVLAASIG